MPSEIAAGIPRSMLVLIERVDTHRRCEPQDRGWNQEDRPDRRSLSSELTHTPMPTPYATDVA